MKEIQLTQGQKAIVDDDLYDMLNCWKWSARWDKHTKSFYAKRNIKRDGKWENISMARVVLHLRKGDGYQVDHINHQTLDNRKENLNVVTNRQNQQNQENQKPKSSKYPGVSWHKASKKWRADITIDGKQKHLGLFPTELDGFRAYINALNELNEQFYDVNNLLKDLQIR